MSDDFAVVLLDVSMPDMDGFETASLIHEHPRFEKTPIIFVTGVHVSELDRLKGYKVGAVDYVSIPVVPEILRSKVARARGAVLQASRAAGSSIAAWRRRTCASRRPTPLCRPRRPASSQSSTRCCNVPTWSSSAANRALQSEITERARIEQALKEADRHKDEFLAMLAHELRNPLAPIRNAVQIMRRKPLADPQLVWTRDVIERQLGHLTRLVDDLLDVSRITRGKINVTASLSSSRRSSDGRVETVQPLIAEKEHELTSACPQARLRWRAISRG